MISTLFKPSALKSKAYINIADSGLEVDSGIRLRLSPDSKANVPLKNDPEMVKGPELAKKQNDGFLKDAGGKSKANIHLDTEDYGYLTIETGEDFLKEREDNLLYKNFGVRAIGKQNMEAGEVDTKTLKFVELINYNPWFDPSYLNNLILKAKKNWKGINADEWLHNMRGDYEA